MNNKKKIAFFMHYRPGGGGVNTLATFYLKQLAKTCEIDLYLEGENIQADIDCYPQELDSVVNSVTYYNIGPFRDVFMNNVSKDFLIQSDIKAIDNFISKFNSIKYESVIMFVGFHEFLFKFMTNAKNKISFVHTRFIAQKELKDFNFLKMSRYCDKWICVSKVASDEFKYYLPQRIDDIHYITNTADFETSLMKSKKVIWNPFELSILNSKVPVIGIVGRIEERQKKVTRMLRVSKRLNELGYKHKMVFIGPLDLEYEHNEVKWREQIKKFNVNNSIFWFKSKKNPYKYLVKFDILALCSKYEGLSIVLMEALSLGVKSIVTSKESLEFLDDKKVCILSDNNEDAIVDNFKNLFKTNFKDFESLDDSAKIVKEKQLESINKLNEYVEGNYEK